MIAFQYPMKSIESSTYIVQEGSKVDDLGEQTGNNLPRLSEEQVNQLRLLANEVRSLETLLHEHRHEAAENAKLLAQQDLEIERLRAAIQAKIKRQEYLAARYIDLVQAGRDKPEL